MKKQLGELLLEDGHVSRDDLQDVLRQQKTSPMKVGQILIKKGLIDEALFMATLARQYGFPFEEHLVFQFDDIFTTIPPALIHKARIAPLKCEGNTIYAAIFNPADIHPMDDFKACLPHHRVKFVIASEAEIMRIIHGQFDQAAEAAKEALEGIHEDEFSDLESLSENTLDMANEAPIIRMVNAILTQGVQERASDIHVEVFEKKLNVRYRIDGILHHRLSPPRRIHSGIVSRIKIMANLNIAENRLPQDGRIKLKLSGKDIDVRVSTIPTQYGERVVMRLLNKSDVKFEMESMGYSEVLLKSLKEIIREPNGILLVTGPTGSGKSTTLYSFLTELNEEKRNIMTVEDPVEYELEGIAQVQTQDKIGLSFASALRSFLRQDPDIIMVGEIRDEETARTAIQAALTGHLVISTLHTNDAASAVTRLTDMGIEPYLITSTIRAVLAQRLVRVICPECKTSYTPSEDELRDLDIQLKDLPDKKLYRGKGCDSCVGTGYMGRLGIFEYLELDEKIQKSVLAGADSDTLNGLALEKGMIGLRVYGCEKVIAGETTVDEIMRVT